MLADHYIELNHLRQALQKVVWKILAATFQEISTYKPSSYMQTAVFAIRLFGAIIDCTE